MGSVFDPLVVHPVDRLPYRRSYRDSQEISLMTLKSEVLTVVFIKIATAWSGDRGGTVVKVLCYKSEGCWFDPSLCSWNSSLT